MNSTAQDSSFEQTTGIWKSFRWNGDWRLLWLVLLLPVALIMPALPIDETRYLAVAWEMYERFDFGLLYLNGQPYAEKGPLLFWLINLVWLFSGPHLWIVRVLALAISAASLLLFQHVANRLNPTGGFARRATLMLAGMVFFSLFSTAVMFDVLLTACVLITLHGVLDLHAKHWKWGVATMAIGLALGCLTKGPVVILDTAAVLLLGPWWSETARLNKQRWYACGAIAVLSGVSLSLAWAIPAALRGGSDYTHAIFLGQTVNRVANSFAHARPFWWYLPILPVMLVPWTLSVRGPWVLWRDAVTNSMSARFAVAWFVPAFVMFSFISGKQPHYLLPLLPAVALYLSGIICTGSARIDGRAFGWTLIVGSIAVLIYKVGLAAMDPAAPLGDIPAAVSNLSPVWPALLGTLGLYMIVKRRASARVRDVALVSLAATTVLIMGAVQAYTPFTDITTAAKRIQRAQDEHASVVSLGPHHGLFEFAGRLTNPIDALSFNELPTWCSRQPTGEVVTFYNKYSIAAKPLAEQPFESGSIRFWRARDVCASLNSNIATASPDEQSNE